MLNCKQAKFETILIVQFIYFLNDFRSKMKGLPEDSLHLISYSMMWNKILFARLDTIVSVFIIRQKSELLGFHSDCQAVHSRLWDCLCIFSIENRLKAANELRVKSEREWDEGTSALNTWNRCLLELSQWRRAARVT